MLVDTGAGTSRVAGKMYTVAADGSDDKNCLNKQASCKTIGFILKNECNSNVQLSIFLDFIENKTHTESCALNSSDISFQCSVTLSGDKVQKPAISFESITQEYDTVQGCYIFPFLFSSCQIPSNNSRTSAKVNPGNDENCTLNFENLHISSLVLYLNVHVHIVAENTDFVDAQITVDAFSKMPCSFYCSSCTFSVSQINTSNRTNERLNQLQFLNCSCLSFDLDNSFLSYTSIDLSFMFLCNIHMHNIIFDEDHEENYTTTSVFIQQREPLSMSQQDSYQNFLTFDNVSMFNQKVTAYVFQIHLLESINISSGLVLQNCLSVQSSGILNYSVSSGFQTLTSIQKIYILDTHVTEADSNVKVINIFSESAGVVIIKRCTFDNNAVQLPLISIGVFKLFFQLVETNFIKNTGSTKVFAVIPEGDLLYNMSTSFVNEVIAWSNLASAAKFQISAAVLQVINCTFLNSKSDFDGVLSFKPTTGSGKTIRNNMFAFTLEIKGSLFKNNTSSSVYGPGTLRIEPDFVPVYLSKEVQAPRVEILIFACKFISNFVDYDGAVNVKSIYQWSLFLNITQSIFDGYMGQRGAGVLVHTSSTLRWDSFVHISKTRFTSNVASVKGSAIYVNFFCLKTSGKMMIYLKESDFVNNVVNERELSDKSGGAFLVSSSFPPSIIFVHVIQTNWRNNTSTTNEAALAFHIYESSSVHITKSEFISNSARLSSLGGACYFNVFKLGEEKGIGTLIQIKDSLFDNNTAAEGGSVFQTSSLALSTELEIHDSVFYCCDKLAGDFIAIIAVAHFKNVNFHSILPNGVLVVPALLLKHKGTYSIGNLSLTCHHADISLSVNQKSTTDNTQQLTLLHSLSASCTKCTAKPFPTGNGSLSIIQGVEFPEPDTKVTRIQTDIDINHPCEPCPFGGECLHERVKALPNYWGYKHEVSIVFFPCPLHYCCNGINVLCDSHDTCAPHRTGWLCGECENGFSESLMSTVCIPNTKCDDWWVWPAGFILAFGYLLWYMYKGNFLSLFQSLVINLYSCVFQQNKICVPRQVDHVDQKPSHQKVGKSEKAEMPTLTFLSIL